MTRPPSRRSQNEPVSLDAADPSTVLSQVRLLGDPSLRRVALPVACDDPDFVCEKILLESVLEAFRAKYGFGRAIAAPQIGLEKRFVALNLGRGPFVIVNPRVIEISPATMTMWDDCMSLPSLMVKVARAPSVVIEYTDAQGVDQQWQVENPAIAELLQHEIDHLDGLLAIDRALDKHSLVMRAVYLEQQDYFDRQVDYVIQPTV